MISHTGFFACINCEIEGIYDFYKDCYPFKKQLILRDKIIYNLCLKEVEFKKSKSSLIKQGECIFKITILALKTKMDEKKVRKWIENKRARLKLKENSDSFKYFSKNDKAILRDYYH
jgi:hypothetical protein